MPIEHLSVGDSQESLGVHTYPNENKKGKLRSVRDKAQEWTDSSEGRTSTSARHMVPDGISTVAEG